MKLSAKKRGEIYDCVHRLIIDKRIEMREGITKDSPIKDKIDYYVAQLEIPLAQAIMRLLDKDYDKGYYK
jgi:hypothetical protein